MNSEELDKIAPALAGAQNDFKAIPKDASNPFFKSRYSTLATVVEAASPILAEHGLAVSQFVSRDYEGRDTLTTWLLHASGQYIKDTMSLHLTKSDAQGQGSAITYARRYSYMAVLGLVADEDDDGNAASRPAIGSEKGTETDATPPKPIPQRLSANQVGLILTRVKQVTGLTERKAIIDKFQEKFGMLPTEVQRDEFKEVLHELNLMKTAGVSA